jgi:hypothetical protein
MAAQLLANAKPSALSPKAAWNTAVAEVFPESSSSQIKGCPRDSFLALCGMGVVKNVAPGTYTRSIKNKGYVERAVDALRSKPALEKDEGTLWQIVTDHADKTPNHQMDVVTTLFRKGFIK